MITISSPADDPVGARDSPLADKNDDTEDQTPEEVTMRDLWRHISGMESRINKRFDAVDARFDDQDKQLEAIRKSVDNDMARHPDLVRVENKVSDVATDVREIKGRVNEVKGQMGKVQSRLDRGGVPA